MMESEEKTNRLLVFLFRQKDEFLMNWLETCPDMEMYDSVMEIVRFREDLK